MAATLAVRVLAPIQLVQVRHLVFPADPAHPAHPAHPAVMGASLVKAVVTGVETGVDSETDRLLEVPSRAA
jgi:hypothetical protein